MWFLFSNSWPIMASRDHLADDIRLVTAALSPCLSLSNVVRMHIVSDRYCVVFSFDYAKISETGLHGSMEKWEGFPFFLGALLSS